jgi:hypothetical protein
MILSPFKLYNSNKDEFLNKICAICFCNLFFPENPENNKFIRCSRLNCNHIFHNDCIQKMMKYNQLNCPECRTPIVKLHNLDFSLELTIRNDAFDNGNVDLELKKKFENTALCVDDYPYHKIVFERWRNEKQMLNK